MSEIRSIVELWKQERSQQNAHGTAVLVTLVRVEGSSYRKPGARLLSCANQFSGSISGGCLEGEVIRKAAWITQSGAAMQRYSTLFDDTSEIPYGLGCGGVVDLLLEPLHLPETQALLSALQQSLTGERLAVVTLLPAESLTARSAGDQPQPLRLQPLRRIVLHANGTLLFASDDLNEASRHALLACAQQGLSQKNSSPYETPLEIDGHTRQVFVEVIKPPQRLFVF